MKKLFFTLILLMLVAAAAAVYWYVPAREVAMGLYEKCVALSQPSAEVEAPAAVQPPPVTEPEPAPAPAAAAAPKPADAEKKNDSADDEITIAPSEKAKKEKVEAANEPAGKDAGKNSRRPVPGKAEPAGNTASPLYLVLGLITLILMLGVTAFTLTQYLDFEQKIQIYEHVPGLPHAK